MSDTSSSMMASLLGRLSSSGLRPIFTAGFKKKKSQQSARFLEARGSLFLTLVFFYNYIWPILFFCVRNVRLYFFCQVRVVRVSSREASGERACEFVPTVTEHWACVVFKHATGRPHAPNLRPYYELSLATNALSLLAHTCTRLRKTPVYRKMKLVQVSLS